MSVWMGTTMLQTRVAEEELQFLLTTENVILNSEQSLNPGDWAVCLAFPYISTWRVRLHRICCLQILAISKCDVINSDVARLQAQHLSSLIGISEDFNHTSLSAIPPTFQSLSVAQLERIKLLLLTDAFSSTSIRQSRPCSGTSHLLINC